MIAQRTRWRTPGYDLLVGTLFLDVEANDNCPYSMQLVFSTLQEPREVRSVKLYLSGPEGALFDVTGWEAGGRPCPARCVMVEDSGQGRAYLVYGGDGGIRYRSAGSGSWDVSDSRQWGESHSLIAEVEDIVWAEGCQ